MMETKRAKELLLQYQKDDCTPQEKQVVEEWYKQLVETGECTLDESGRKQLQELMEARLLELINNQKELVHEMPSWRTRGWWAVAASIVLALGFASYFLLFNNPKQEVARIVTEEQRFKNDVDPGQYKARLTLADGRTIILDSAALGELVKQGNTIVLNKKGQLVYKAGGNNSEVLYNTLSTAKGEMYATVLADGSKVWLNSVSSIKYPVAFTGKERRVEITGEAYFEIKHDSKMPFVVNVNGMEVHDLGTEFNINAYADEEVIKTTLVEGSAKVVKENNSQLLSPGQQLQLNTTGEMNLINNADIDEAVAWRSGRFLFKSIDIKNLMRQLTRWYDVDVNYETVPVTRFNAKISRETPLSSILKALELTGEVRFRIEGKKVVVMR